MSKFSTMVEENENEDSLNLEDEAIVTEEETTSSEETSEGQPVPINLAKLKVEDLDTLEPEKIKELAAKLIPQNKKLFTRAKTAEDKIKPTVQPSNSGAEEKSIPSWGQELQKAERKRQFGYENGLSPEETDTIFRFNPKPNKNTLQDPFIKAGLEAMRAKQRIENATPSSSGRTATFNGKQLHEMDEKDAAQNYANLIKQSVDSRRK